MVTRWRTKSDTRRPRYISQTIRGMCKEKLCMRPVYPVEKQVGNGRVVVESEWCKLHRDWQWYRSLSNGR